MIQRTTEGKLYFGDFANMPDGPAPAELIEPDPSWVQSRQTHGDARARADVWYIEGGKLCLNLGVASFYQLLADIDPVLQAVVSVIAAPPPVDPVNAPGGERTYGPGAIARYSMNDDPEPSTVRQMGTHTDWQRSAMEADREFWSAWMEANGQDPTYNFSAWAMLDATFNEFSGVPGAEIRTILAASALGGAADKWGEFEIIGQTPRVDVVGDEPTLEMPAGLFGLRATNALNGDPYIQHFTELAIYRSEQVQCSGLTDGDILRIGAYESDPAVGGVATIDMTSEHFPLTDPVEVVRGGSVIDSVSPTGGVWGGDEYLYEDSGPAPGPAGPSRPLLVFGRGMVAELLRYGVGNTDAGVPVQLLHRTIEVAPAGVAGKAAYHRLYLGVTFSVPFRLRLQPIIDGKVPGGEYAEIEVAQAAFDANGWVLGERRTHLFEVAMSLPYERGGIERFRYAMQGTYFQVEITQPEPLADEGELILEGLELEYEVLTKGGVQ